MLHLALHGLHANGRNVAYVRVSERRRWRKGTHSLMCTMEFNVSSSASFRDFISAVNVFFFLFVVVDLRDHSFLRNLYFNRMQAKIGCQNTFRKRLFFFGPNLYCLYTDLHFFFLERWIREMYSQHISRNQRVIYHIHIMIRTINKIFKSNTNKNKRKV